MSCPNNGLRNDLVGSLFRPCRILRHRPAVTASERPPSFMIFTRYSPCRNSACRERRRTGTRSRSYPVMPAVPHVAPPRALAVRDARSPPRMAPAPIAADETESPFVVIVPQGFHNCTHARDCALQPTPPLPQLVPKASAFFWLHGRTRAAMRALREAMRALRDDPGPSGRSGVIEAARDLLTEFFAQRWSHKVLVIQYKRSAG